MQGSFEKKVQEKMDELTMHPSAPVWEKIALQLGPEKKRRRVFFWISVAACILIAAAWMIYTTDGQKPAAAETTLSTGNRIPSVIIRQEPENVAKEKLPGKNNLQIFRSNRNEKTRSLPYWPVEEQMGSSITTVAPKYRNNKTSSLKIPYAGPLPEKSGEDKNGSIIAGSRGKEIVADWLNEIQIESDKDTVNTTSGSNQLPVLKDSIATAEENPRAERSMTATDSGRTKNKLALPSGWRLALALQGGWNKPSSAMLTTARLASNNTTTQGAGYSSAFAGPNAVSGGASFSMAAGLTKNALRNRLSVSIGLQYTFHQMHTRVGAFRQLDTMFSFNGSSIPVDGYYRNGINTAYPINYHLLEVPISIGYRLFSSLPLTLSAGAAYGRLLKSNALTYHATGNNFYYNRKNITTDYVSVSSSLQYNIVNRPKLQVGLGPVVNYYLSSLQKQPAVNAVRLSFAGFKSSIVF